MKGICKRSGGNLDGVEVLVDGASWINGFRLEHLRRYILAHHHLCEKVKERFVSVIENVNVVPPTNGRIKDCRKSVDELMRILNAGEVDSALSYIDGLSRIGRRTS
jgi:hypothetical protein